MRHKWMISLAFAVPGCGSALATTSPFAEHVAQSFASDCHRPHPPTPAAASQLNRLCSCSVARIRASDIGFGDGQDAITAKVQAAMRACSREEDARQRRRR